MLEELLRAFTKRVEHTFSVIINRKNCTGFYSGMMIVDWSSVHLGKHPRETSSTRLRNICCIPV